MNLIRISSEEERIQYMSLTEEEQKKWRDAVLEGLILRYGKGNRYIYVIDSITNTITELEIPKYIAEEDDIYDFLNEHGFSPFYCSWGFLDKKVDAIKRAE